MIHPNIGYLELGNFSLEQSNYDATIGWLSAAQVFAFKMIQFLKLDPYSRDLSMLIKVFFKF